MVQFTCLCALIYHIAVLFKFIDKIKIIDPSLSHAWKSPQTNRGLATVTRRGRSGKLSSEGNMPKRCAYGCANLIPGILKVWMGWWNFFPSQNLRPKGRNCNYSIVCHFGQKHLPNPITINHIFQLACFLHTGSRLVATYGFHWL